MTLDYRSITAADAAIVTFHRHAMFEAMGYDDTALLESMDDNFLPWVRRRLTEGSYVGWFALDLDKVAAGAGIWLQDWPPHVLDPHGPRAYILNIFVEQEYRRRGIARQLMHLCLAWCAEHKINVVTLHASEEGRPLYESLGFSASNEMRLNPRH